MSMVEKKHLLQDYSEWLDLQGLIRDPDESNDNRVHGVLVKDFLEEYTGYE